MDGEAVKAIIEEAKSPQQLGDFIAAPNNWSVMDPASLIKPGPSATTLKVSTLGAVRDYIKANRDALDLAKLVVHVGFPNAVYVMGPLDVRSRTRETYLSAIAADMTDGFLGSFMSLENFLLGLQVRFADADDRKKVLGLLSTVKHETVKTAMDDGMTQMVQARAGTVLVSDVPVPNPVLLCGIRSFRDIAHPSSFYVLRVQSGPNGGLPQVGLFEADGGAWRLSAIERVREWLHEALPQDVSVLA